MLRIVILGAASAVAFPSQCGAQTPTDTPATVEEGEENIPVNEPEMSNENGEGRTLGGDLKLVFVLLMFTNAIICGQWALSTDRNFWGWYLFGLFTGPLAGGSMLHYHALEKSGEAQVSALAGILGIVIPIAGFVIWAWLLS